MRRIIYKAIEKLIIPIHTGKNQFNNEGNILK